MKAKIIVLGTILGLSPLAFADFADAHFNVLNVKTFMTAALSDFGTQVLAVLTAVIGVAIAYFLFKFAWRKIKGSVQ
jgi:hypothetical protein